MNHAENMQEQEAPLPSSFECADFPSVDAPKRSETDKQSEHYTEIVEAFKKNYIDKRDANRRYKCVFFWVTIGILMVVVGGFAALCVGLLLHADRWMVVLPVMAGGAATVIVALLKLPKIIAEHLFPLNEDQAMVDLIKALKDKSVTNHT